MINFMKTHTCKPCDETYGTLSYLEDHMLMNHQAICEVKPYTCNICNKFSDKTQYLDDHVQER